MKRALAVSHGPLLASWRFPLHRGRTGHEGVVSRPLVRLHGGREHRRLVTSSTWAGVDRRASFASGSKTPGAMFTAPTIRPVQRAEDVPGQAAPIGEDSGLKDILVARRRRSGTGDGSAPGSVEERRHLGGLRQALSLVCRCAALRPLKVAVDAGNGMAGQDRSHRVRTSSVRDFAALFRA